MVLSMGTGFDRGTIEVQQMRDLERVKTSSERARGVGAGQVGGDSD